MKKEEFLNTKWDAREWSEDMKRDWEKRVHELGFRWNEEGETVPTADVIFYYLHSDGRITWSGDDFIFESTNHPYKECSYSFAFPEALTWQGQKHDTNKSDGSTASYYELPDGASELQDLISYRNMNAQDGEMFRALYRKGRASHSDALRDAKKVLFYAQAEVERLEKYGE